MKPLRANRISACLTACLLVAGVLLCRFAEAADDEVAFASGVTVGQQRAVSIERHVEVTDVSGMDFYLVWKQAAVLEAIGESGKGMDYRWTLKQAPPQEVEVLGLERSVGTGVGGLPNLLGDLDIEYRVARAGNGMEILNAAALQASIAQLQPSVDEPAESWLVRITSRPRATNLGDKQVAALKDAIGSVMMAFKPMQKGQLAAIFLDEAPLIHALEGRSLKLNNPVAYAAELPNEFGDPGISATGTLTLSKIDSAAGTGSVELRREFMRPKTDGEMTRALLRLDRELKEELQGHWAPVEIANVKVTEGATSPSIRCAALSAGSIANALRCMAPTPTSLWRRSKSKPCSRAGSDRT